MAYERTGTGVTSSPPPRPRPSPTRPPRPRPANLNAPPRPKPPPVRPPLAPPPPANSPHPPRPVERPSDKERDRARPRPRPRPPAVDTRVAEDRNVRVPSLSFINAIKKGTLLGALFSPTRLGDGTPDSADRAQGWVDKAAPELGTPARPVEEDAPSFVVPRELPDPDPLDLPVSPTPRLTGPSVYVSPQRTVVSFPDGAVSAGLADLPLKFGDVFSPIELPLPEDFVEPVVTRPDFHEGDKPHDYTHPLFPSNPTFEPSVTPDGIPARGPIERTPDVPRRRPQPLPDVGLPPQRAPTVGTVPDRTIEVSFTPNGQPQIAVRNGRQRPDRRRRNDTKGRDAAKLKAAYGFINATWGTVDEVLEFAEIVVWNIYLERGGKAVPAMAIEGGDYNAALTGLIEGKYELDVGGVILDFAIAQAQDAVIGRLSQMATSQFVEAGFTGTTGPNSVVKHLDDWSRYVSSF